MGKYNAGDLVTFELNYNTAEKFNNQGLVYFGSHQAIKHQPAPFDWKDAKLGMAFKHEDGSTFIFLKPCPLGFDFCISRLWVGKNSSTLNLLNRFPEADIEVPHAD